MEKSLGRRAAMTLLELMIAMSLLAVIIPSASFASLRALSHWRYKQDVERLQAHLQLAHDISLNCQIPVEIQFDQQPRGFVVSLNFENEHLQEKLQSKRLFKNIYHFEHSSGPSSQLKILCLFSGSLKEPITLKFFDHKRLNPWQLNLKGYPHVVHIEKAA